MTDGKVRVGLLLDSPVVPRWIEKVVRDIASSDYATISLVVYDAPDATGERPTSLARLLPLSPPWDALSTRLYEAYERADYRKFRSVPDALEESDITVYLSGVPALRVRPLRVGCVDRFRSEDVRAIREHELDVLIQFGFQHLEGDLLQAARCGIWSCRHHDDREYRGEPALFWEMYEQSPVSGTVLQVRAPKLDGGRVLYRSLASTVRRSLYLNRNQTYWKTAAFLPRRLRDLSRDGWGALTGLNTFNEDTGYAKELYRKPTTLQMARFLLRLLGETVRSADRLFQEQWFLAVRRRAGTDWTSLAQEQGGRGGFRLIVPARSRFYADPFLIEYQGATHLFFEDYCYAAGKGKISCCILSEEGVPGQIRTALERPYHLSYPFVFKWNGRMFMVPETGDNGTVELYVAERFPDRWRLEAVLLEGVAAYDATLCRHRGRWWMFVNVAEYGASSWDELHLYYADQLVGPWLPHKRNPVISDVTQARPAGRILESGDALIRPAQDSSATYGRAVKFCRIDELSESAYRQTVIGCLEPSLLRGCIGTHTYNCSERFEVLDAKRKIWKPLL